MEQEQPQQQKKMQYFLELIFKEITIVARITNEVLYTEIKNIKEDTTLIKKDSKEMWKHINKNSQCIASQKSAIKIVEVFVVGIIGSIVAYVWKGHS